MQDEKLIVLEPAKIFASFAESKGWKNLAKEYLDDENNDYSSDITADSRSRALFSALMDKLQAK